MPQARPDPEHSRQRRHQRRQIIVLRQPYMLHLLLPCRPRHCRCCSHNRQRACGASCCCWGWWCWERKGGYVGMCAAREVGAASAAADLLLVVLLADLQQPARECPAWWCNRSGSTAVRVLIHLLLFSRDCFAVLGSGYRSH
jgi:hypothetical protein